MNWLLANASPTVAEAFRACRRHFVGVLGFSALMNVLFLVPTIYVMQVYDRVIPTSGLQTLLYLTIIAALALGALSLLDVVRSRLLVRSSLRLERLLSGPLLERLMAEPTPAGRGPVLRDLDVLRQAIVSPGSSSFADAIWTPVYVAVAFMIHPALGALTIAGGAVLVTLAVLTEGATRERGGRADGILAAVYGVQDSLTRNAGLVRALGMGKPLRDRQLVDRGVATQLAADAQIAGGRYLAATKGVRLFLQTAAMGLGAWLAVERQISPGSIMVASILMSRGLQPVEQIVGFWPTVLKARVALKALNTAFAAPQAGPRTQMPAPAGRLRFENVVYRAPGSGTELLKDISFSVGPGEVLGVVGASGAGKTTLAALAAGAAAPDGGAVRLDGATLRDWDQDRLGRHIGYLPQNNALLMGSVRDNISRFAQWRGDSAETIDAAVVAAAKAAGAHDMILRLSKGYDTVVSEGGGGLSAGQAQRVALARALYGDPALLVLDEPNSCLDAQGEAQLAKALGEARARGAAVIIVAHRMGILSGVDTLLVLRDGVVERTGPRETVVAAIARRPARSSNVLKLKG